MLPVHQAHQGFVANSPLPSSSSLLGVALSLVFVLALVLFLAWLARRTRILGVWQGGPMQIRATLALGHRERLVLVEVDGRRLLLGVTQEQVRMLLELDAVTSANEPSQEDFVSRLSALIKGGVH